MISSKRDHVEVNALDPLNEFPPHPGSVLQADLMLQNPAASFRSRAGRCYMTTSTGGIAVSDSHRLSRASCYQDRDTAALEFCRT